MSKKVVVSGSRSIKVLPEEVKAKLNEIVSLGFEILIGDAYGVDSLVQQYLKSIGYSKVTVYFVADKPRNNAGFQCHKLSPKVLAEYAVRSGVGSSYSARDNYMCCMADYGLAIWDGKSRGTQANIKRVPTRVMVIS